MAVYGYLAGPIGQVTEPEAKGWRDTAASVLWEHGIVAVDPLRSEPAVNGRYDSPALRADLKFGSAKAINAKNRLDLRRSDFVLVYHQDGPVSVGTVMEIAWASQLCKPIIMVCEQEYLRDHPLITEAVDWMLPSLADAYDVALKTFSVYRPYNPLRLEPRAPSAGRHNDSLRKKGRLW